MMPECSTQITSLMITAGVKLCRDKFTMFDSHRRLRLADALTLFVSATRHKNLSDHALPVAAATAWNMLPSLVRQLAYAESIQFSLSKINNDREKIQLIEANANTTGIIASN